METFKPKLRAVDARPFQHAGQAMILLRDPLELGSSSLAVPRPLAPLLGLMDGTRDEDELEAALRVRAGVRLAPGLLPKLLADLDEVFLLENDRFRSARAAALDDYRRAPFRRLNLNSVEDSPDPDRMGAYLAGHLDGLPAADPLPTDRPVRGLISPHIDYHRGGPVYAQVWRAAAPAALEADLVIVFGTDHQGGHGTVTLTRQSYATPWGILPTDADLVQGLAAALGEEAAFAEELHHRGEHSIELAAVWLHFIRRGRPTPILPILCGSFAGFVDGQADPGDHEPFRRALDLLRPVLADRRVLVVAAADLAHVGPAFGDRAGLDFVARAQLRRADERLLETVYAGDAAAFFGQLKAEGDRRHVCGLPPIYLTLRLLEDASGAPAGYDLCPADAEGLSCVSIAGVLLH